MSNAAATCSSTEDDTLLSRGKHLAKTAHSIGFLHLLVSMFFLQGTAYLTQLIVANALSPADFGIVREIEAIISVAVVFGSCGMASLAIKSVAEAKLDGSEFSLISRMLKIAASSSAIVGLVLVFVVSLFLSGESAYYLSALGGVVFFTATARTGLNFFQGVKQVRLYSYCVALLSFCSLIAVASLVYTYGIDGWLAGRYFSEVLFALGALFLLFRYKSGKAALKPNFSVKALLGLGVPISLSLLVRSLLENAGLLSLAWFGSEREVVGYFGFGSILFMAALTLPGVICNLFLPRMAEQLSEKPRARLLVRNTSFLIFASSVFVSLGVVLLLPFICELLFPQYLESLSLVQILFVAFPFRALISLFGAGLMVCDKNFLTLKLNAAQLIISFPVFAYLAANFTGGEAVAVGILLSEVVMALVLHLFLKRELSDEEGLSAGGTI